jgi:hypothetical protein
VCPQFVRDLAELTRVPCRVGIGSFCTTFL